ncbi:MAG TPA: C2H2-type zinc finger protein [Thermoplasmata archaeon]|nr:C2H2-type zinc finger protein [Thermoplasmata archaeon]
MGAVAALSLLVLAGAAVVGIGFMAGSPAFASAPLTPHGVGARTLAHTSPAASAAHPSAPPSPPILATVVITTQPPASSPVPVNFNFSITVVGVPISAKNVSIFAAAWHTSPSELVGNWSIPVTAGQTAFAVSYGYQGFDSLNFQNKTTPGGAYTFQVWVTAHNATNKSVTPSTASATTTSVNVWVIDASVTVGLLPLYQVVPFNLTYVISVSGNQGVPVNINNLAATVEVDYQLGACDPQFGIPCPLVTNNTVPLTNATTSYSTTVDSAFLTAANFGGATSASQLPSGQYRINVWLTVTNTTSAAAAPRVVGGGHITYLVINPTSGVILSPANGTTISTGNTTISVAFGGDFLSGANVTVTNGAGSIVFSNGVFVSGSGIRGSSTSTPWVATTPGAYKIWLTTTTQYGVTFKTAANVTVVAAGQTVYQNSSSYQNATVIPGLSGPIAGTILILVGLIVGMGVAFALGRAMWGGAKPSPAQPWSGGAATAPNECPVCHQTFPTEDAMKEHQKTAHGVS